MNPYVSLNAQASPDFTRSKLEAAWESFNIQEVTSFDVRPLIVESWKRCHSQGIHPLQKKSTLITEEYNQNSMSENPLVFDQDQILSGLNDLGHDLGHLVVLTDANGTILSIDGDVNLRHKAENMQFVTGSSWAESHAGTNAIGVALLNRSPVQIFAAEHFCQEVHSWTCSASPIRDPATHQILGVLDLTGPWQVSHPYTLSAVVLATRAIEERLRYKLEFQRAKVMEYCMDEIFRGRNTWIIALDRGDNVIKASPKMYERGWIDASNRLIGYPVRASKILELERNWEVDRKDGKWGFALRTCLLQGQPIGAIIQVMPPNEKSRSSGGLSTKYSFASLIGCSQPFLAALSDAQSAARSELPVLIEGESGTGKELLAQSIHAASYRATGPFIAVNCGAIPKELAASEFFGYEGGAFTGATKEGRTGKFEQANGGTIFLDEIGELPLDLQTLMLRVLEEKEVVRLGGRKPIQVNIRIIAATNRNLLVDVEQGRFRRDLYYRLNVLSQRIPPLRERQGDILLLLEHFLEKICNEIGRSPIEMDEEALKVLQDYSWPGNVRELRNVAYRIGARLIGNVIQVTNLPEEILENMKNSSAVKKDFSKTRTTLKNQEIQHIRKILNELDGNVSEAATRLGIHRSTIYRKLGQI